jgi:hypothetical protein
MTRRVVSLFAVAALFLLGAAPVSAAPGGVPGPPPDHWKAADDGDVAVGDVEAKELPDWAKAYGKRIKDEFGMPYGHVQQCARYLAGDMDEDVDADIDADESEDEKAPKWLEACEELEETPVLPEGAHGAKAFWVSVSTEVGIAVLAT